MPLLGLHGIYPVFDENNNIHIFGGGTQVGQSSSQTHLLYRIDDPCQYAQNWSPWSPCSTTCDAGLTTRSKAVIFGPASCSALTESSSCNGPACPTPCIVRGWTAWSPCTATCGSGQRTRFLVIVARPTNGGQACPALSETESCADFPCAVGCVVSDWSVWSPCSATCDTSVRTRNRSILVNPSQGGALCPPLTDVQRCLTPFCPIDCAVNQWSSWSACSAECGGGERARTRIINTVSMFGGAPCPALFEANSCNTQQCIVNCSVGEWAPWSPCLASCGETVRYRLRPLLVPNSPGGTLCPSLIDIGPCSSMPCPVDCTVAAWSAWSGCSATCGPSKSVRTRSVTSPALNGGSCPHTIEAINCTSDPCPVPCNASLWTPWSVCSNSCGPGTTNRTRTVLSPALFGGTCGALAQQQPCVGQQCPVDCVLSHWTVWSACPANLCDGASMNRTRTRTVLQPALFGGVPCPELSTSLNATAPCVYNRSCTLTASLLVNVTTAAPWLAWSTLGRNTTALALGAFPVTASTGSLVARVDYSIAPDQKRFLNAELLGFAFDLSKIPTIASSCTIDKNAGFETCALNASIDVRAVISSTNSSLTTPGTTIFKLNRIRCPVISGILGGNVSFVPGPDTSLLCKRCALFGRISVPFSFVPMVRLPATAVFVDYARPGRRVLWRGSFKTGPAACVADSQCPLPGQRCAASGRLQGQCNCAHWPEYAVPKTTTTTAATTTAATTMTMTLANTSNTSLSAGQVGSAVTTINVSDASLNGTVAAAAALVSSTAATTTITTTSSTTANGTVAGGSTAPMNTAAASSAVPSTVSTMPATTGAATATSGTKPQ
jgi:hypothetical protein